MEISELEDRFKIHDLFVRYTFAVDNSDEAQLLSCFTEDALLETPILGGGRFAGRQGQREFIRAGRARNEGTKMRHVLTNLNVEINGDTGTAKAYLVIYVTKNGKTELFATGGYDCKLKKLGGDWFFEHRRVLLDAIPSQGP